MTSYRDTLRFRLGSLRLSLLAPLHFARSRAELKRHLPREFSAAAIWEVTKRYRGHGWFRTLSAWQVESEYLALVNAVHAQRPRVIAEIGTNNGGTLLAWSRIAAELVISIDLPGGIHGGGYPAAKARLYRELTSDRSGVRSLILQDDSQKVATRQRVEAELQGRTIDFLFIDGDHRYAGVARDFELWSPLVTPGGAVAFHDILVQRTRSDCEVDRLWRELKTRYPHTEFIGHPDQGWAGVGLLRMPGPPPPPGGDVEVRDRTPRPSP